MKNADELGLRRPGPSFRNGFAENCYLYRVTRRILTWQVPKERSCL